jgi:hypothetical protein
MLTWARANRRAAGIGLLDSLDASFGIMAGVPLEKPSGIAAALPDSKARAHVRESDRVKANGGEFERKVPVAEPLRLLAGVPGARGRAEATVRDRVGVGADADIELMGMVAEVQADRRRAELRHLSSISNGSCSTLLTRIGPAIAGNRADDRAAALVPTADRADGGAATSGEDVLLKRSVHQRAFVPGRKHEWLQRVSLQADAAASVCAGSRGGRWQGHLFLGVCREGVAMASRPQKNGAGKVNALPAMAFSGLLFRIAKLHPDCESYGRVPPNMPHPPLPPNPPTGRPNAPARTHSSRLVLS